MLEYSLSVQSHKRRETQAFLHILPKTISLVKILPCLALKTTCVESTVLKEGDTWTSQPNNPVFLMDENGGYHRHFPLTSSTEKGTCYQLLQQEQR